MEKSIVSILCKYAIVDAYSPWTISYDSSSGIGSGSFIEYEGDIMILTCWHVIRDATNITLKYYPTDTEFEGETYKVSIELDLCLVKFKDDKVKKHCKPLTVAATMKRGEKIRVVGFPENIENYAITEGVYSRLYMSQYLYFRSVYIQSDVLVNGGNSGGPVINEKGQLVGIVQAKTVKDNHDNTALINPWFAILYFMKMKGESVECRRPDVRSKVLPNTYFKEFYGIPKNVEGLLVAQGTPDNIIKQDDIIISVDGVEVTERGRINFHDNKLPWWVTLCFDSKKTTNIELYRGGKKIKVVYKYEDTRDLIDLNPFHDSNKKYYFLAGFVFGVNNYNVIQYQRDNDANMTCPDKISTSDPKEEDVLLLSIAPTPCTKGYYVNDPQHVLRLNDKPVKNLKQFHTAVTTSDSKFIHIATDHMEIVIPREYIRKNKELAKTMINTEEAYLGK
nr:hypothetical protein K-LCC10_0476 [Kaumoebavirus]